MYVLMHLIWVSCIMCGFDRRQVLPYREGTVRFLNQLLSTVLAGQLLDTVLAGKECSWKLCVPVGSPWGMCVPGMGCFGNIQQLGMHSCLGKFWSWVLFPTASARKRVSFFINMCVFYNIFTSGITGGHRQALEQRAHASYFVTGVTVCCKAHLE